MRSSTPRSGLDSEPPWPHSQRSCNDSPGGRIVQIALVPSQGTLDVLDYVVPEELSPPAEVGSRVVVPLGRRFVMGVVVGTLTRSEVPELRPVTATLDSSGPLFDGTLLSLARWLAEYYLGSLGDAIATMIPSVVRVRVRKRLYAPRGALEAVQDARDRAVIEHVLRHNGVRAVALRRRIKDASPARLNRLCRDGLLQVRYEAQAAVPLHLGRPNLVRVAHPLPEVEADVWMRKRPALWRCYEYLLHHPLGVATIEELKASFPNVGTKLRVLEEAGIIQRLSAQPEPAQEPEELTALAPVKLSAAQREAVTRVTQALGSGFRPFLLHGVTGSGKTEVYLQAARACVDAGKSVLVLVPEISLTHQLVAALRQRFGAQVALLHSGLSPRERWHQWQRIAAGQVRIVAGARSAVFAPLRNLGLVVVDEEHDAAYKQEEGLRYHARDVAVMRASLTHCPVVLASATPSLESYYNADRGRYELLHLPERVDTRPLPAVEIVDLRRANTRGRALPFSRTLRSALAANLASKQQSLLFLNRRGYARFLQCLHCGLVLLCPNCSVSLTYHQRKAALQCHHCGRTTPAPTQCPHCQHTAMAAWSAGTEQVEQTLRTWFPKARIARLDRDVATRSAALAEIVRDWADGRYDFLVGTQMVAKGHHAPNVTLVAVILAELSRNFPDFRAAERTFQLLTQVAGRAGRGDKPGRVIVQTYRPEDPVIRWAAQHDYEGFVRYELAQRQELAYPPFSRLLLARFEAREEHKAQETAREFADSVRALAGTLVTVLGPAPAPLLRLRGWYRWQVLLRSPRSALLRQAATRARELLTQALPRKARVRVILDVDPQSLL
ncbi:MAG: hypothetical protein KatS3mg077_1112 [Candidatus Binatia bacterium]|nr:MAG: hypothetical protein KatS3mg077_1112 [Candidatus Binatia bacterium]